MTLRSMPSSFRAICRTSETQPINQTVGESDHLGALMVGLFDVLVGWVFLWALRCLHFGVPASLIEYASDLGFIAG